MSVIRAVDLEALVRWLEALPVIPLSQAGSSEQRLRWAREDLKKAGVVLRGHKTAIDQLLQYEIERKSATLMNYDESVAMVLEAPTSGRPNKHSALRDFFILTHCHMVRTRLNPNLKQVERIARKRTAQFFRLTSDTKHARTQRPSVDQVKWAEQRTLARFAPIARGTHLLGLAWTRAIYVLGFYIAEVRGAPIDAEGFAADGATLVSICRTLDFVERLDRLSKSDDRKAEKYRGSAIVSSPGARAN